MANMDYPGPGPTCSGIKGCSTDIGGHKAIANYCGGLNDNLNMWHVSLRDTLSKIDSTDLTNRESLNDTLNLVKSTVREIEFVRDEISNVCTFGAEHSSEDFSPGLLGG